MSVTDRNKRTRPLNFFSEFWVTNLPIGLWFYSAVWNAILTSALVERGAEYGKNKLTYMEDTYLSQSHVCTYIDGLGHIGIRDRYQLHRSYASVIRSKTYPSARDEDAAQQGGDPVRPERRSRLYY